MSAKTEYIVGKLCSEDEKEEVSIFQDKAEALLCAKAESYLSGGQPIFVWESVKGAEDVLCLFLAGIAYEKSCNYGSMPLADKIALRDLRDRLSREIAAEEREPESKNKIERIGMNILIWWTNEADCRAIDSFEGKNTWSIGFPQYIQNQYRDRLGRNGRGRLWADKRFPGVSVEPWPDTAMGRILGEIPSMGQTYAGIVIEEQHVHLLDELPGIVTDMQLRRYRNQQRKDD